MNREQVIKEEKSKEQVSKSKGRGTE